jgi:hypothetical protein
MNFFSICARCEHERIDSTGQKPNPQCAEGHDCFKAMQHNECEHLKDDEES